MLDNLNTGPQRMMKFDKPVFHDGINATIRRGVEWANLQNGELFLAITPDGERKALLRHQYTQVMSWKDARQTKDFGECINDPDLQTMTDIEKLLHKAYEEFHNFEVVSIVYFTVAAYFEV